MKIIHYLYAILTILLLMLLPSCTLTEDDTEDQLYGAAGTFSTLGTVIMNGENLFIESDLYGTLTPENPETITSIDADSTGQRILAGFIFLTNPNARTAIENRPVRIVDFLYKVQTLPASDLRDAGEDIFGNSPLQISDVTLSKNHLNIQYSYKGSAQHPHRFNLILTSQSTIDANGLLPVEFRHDACNDSSGQTMESIVSFTLESIPECQLPGFKGFRIIYNSGANSQAEWKASK